MLAHAAAQARPVSDADVRRSYSRRRRRWKGVSRVKAQRRIRGLLERRRKARSVLHFLEVLLKHYRAITACAPGYEIRDCGAAPLSPTAPPTASPPAPALARRFVD